MARLDLPAPEDAPDIVSELAASVARDGGRASLVAVYDDREWDARTPPHGDLVTALLAELDRTGAPAKDAAYVTADRYWSYVCRGRSCCPPEGASLAEAMTSPMAATLVLAGLAPLPSRRERVAGVYPSSPLTVAAVTESAWRCLESFAGAIEEAAGAGTDPAAAMARAVTRRSRAAAALVDELLVAYRSGPAVITPEQAGELVASLQHVAVRDDLLLRFCRVGLPLPSGPPRDSDGEPLPGLGPATPPDREHEETVGRLLLDLCARIDGPLAAAPLCVLAWHAWARGDGALARIAVDRALAEDPSYRLAGLIGTLLDHGVAPDWVGAARRADEAAS